MQHLNRLLAGLALIAGLAGTAGAADLKVGMIALAPIGLPGSEGTWVVSVAQPAPLMVNEALLKGTEGSGIKVVTNERYARSDTSVSGQRCSRSSRPTPMR